MFLILHPDNIAQCTRNEICKQIIKKEYSICRFLSQKKLINHLIGLHAGLKPIYYKKNVKSSSSII